MKLEMDESSIKFRRTIMDMQEKIRIATNYLGEDLNRIELLRKELVISLVKAEGKDNSQIKGQTQSRVKKPMKEIFDPLINLSQGV